MPQFDFYSFSSQNFWFLMLFFFSYFFILFFFLVSFLEVLNFRIKFFDSFTSYGSVLTINFYNLFSVYKVV